MQQDRQNAVEFWRLHQNECCPIRSIKEVYQKYKEYAVTNSLPVYNEYKFRTYIRKNGYNNSGEKMKIPLTDEERRVKREAKKKRQVEMKMKMKK